MTAQNIASLLAQLERVEPLLKRLAFGPRTEDAGNVRPLCCRGCAVNFGETHWPGCYVDAALAATGRHRHDLLVEDTRVEEEVVQLKETLCDLYAYTLALETAVMPLLLRIAGVPDKPDDLGERIDEALAPSRTSER